MKCDEDKTVDEAEHFRGEFVAVTFGVAPSALSHPKKRCVVQKVLPCSAVGHGQESLEKGQNSSPAKVIVHLLCSTVCTRLQSRMNHQRSAARHF